MEIKIDKLIEKAKTVQVNAYSPYSHYKVGAAILTAKGNIFTGANVENCSYGGTICAERSAICTAVSSEGNEMRLKAVCVITASSPPAPPCGLCLQVLAEFGDDELSIILTNNKGEVEKTSLINLLGRPFRGSSLVK
jgi:cytidine deaminase